MNDVTCTALTVTPTLQELTGSNNWAIDMHTYLCLLIPLYHKLWIFIPRPGLVLLTFSLTTLSVSLISNAKETHRWLWSTAGGNATVTLKQALYIPTYPQDMFSVQAATTRGATVVFTKGKNVLKCRDGTTFNICMYKGQWRDAPKNVFLKKL